MRARRWIAPLLCALLAFACFLPAWHAPFVEFDDTILLGTERFHGFSAENLRWMATATRMGHWMPLTWLSYALDWQLHGSDAAGYHLTNILLHALAAALVCALARELLARARPEAAARAPLALEAAALLAGLLFALHPLRAESVAWVTERRDVLSGALLAGALLAWLAAVESGGPLVARRGRYAAAIALHALSLGAKAWGMVLAPVLLVLDVYPLRRLPADPRRWWRGDARAVLLEKLPFLVLGLVCAGIANRAVDYVPGTLRTWSEWGLDARLAQACHGLWFYASRTLWPFELTPLVELPRTFHALEPRLVAGYVFVLAAPLALWLVRRRAPALVAASVVYLLVLLPVLGFKQAGPQLVADRYSYLACIGFAFALAAGAWQLAERARWRPIVACASLALLGALFVLAQRQARIWHSTQTLWTHAVEHGAPSAIAERGYALVLAGRGEFEPALAHLERAATIDPGNAEVWMALGKLRQQRGEREAAARAFREAARTGEPAYLGWMALGKLQRDELGDPDGALMSFRAAVASVESSKPELMNPFAYLALGEELARHGQKDEARRALGIAARYDKTAAAARAALDELNRAP